MKSVTKILALLLSVCMLGIAISTYAFAGTPDDFTLKASKTSVNVGDTFSVTISNVETSLSAMTLVMKFDNTLVQCTGLTNVDGDDGDDDLFMYYLNSKGKERQAYPDAGYCTVDDINDNSQFQFLILGTEDLTYLEGDVVVFQFKAIAAGTVDFSLKTTVVDANGEIAETVSQIVTIKAAPVCTHTTTKTTYVNNGDGTHTATVTCTDTCKEVVDTKTEGHDFENGDCVCGEKYVPVYTHSLTPVSGKTPTCKEEGWRDYYQCQDSACGCGKYYVDADGAEEILNIGEWQTGEGKLDKDASNHGSNFRYTSDGAGTNTHTKYCLDCSNAIEGEKNIACEDASGDNNHACDANCGNTSVTAHTPEADDGDCTTPVLCTECGTETTAAKTHVADADDYNCTTPVKCVNCSKNVIEAMTHADAENDGDHICDNGECNIECSTHTGGTATCVRQAVCTDCSQSYGEYDPDNHEETTSPIYVDNGNGTHQNWQGCWQCDTKLNLINENDPCRDEWTFNPSVVKTPDGLCDCCGAVMHTCTLTHVEAKDATCSATGNKEYWYCSDETCGKYYSDANGENEITDKTSVTIPVDANNHGKTKGFRFDPVDDTYHNSHCLDCGKVVENSKVTHDYTTGEDPHTCICGAVETFTLTVADMAYYGMGAEKKTFEVPYGTKILEYLEGKVDTDDVLVDSDSHKGYRVWTGKWLYAEKWEELDENSTMTGDMRIDALTYDTGWVLREEDPAWGYQNENGNPVYGWYEIDGAWYYFLDSETTGWSYRAEGLTRVPYPETAINGVTYAPNAEDVTYHANKGIAFKDAEEAWFVFGEDGKFQNNKTGLENGKYIENGMIAWHPGFVNVGGTWYYFVADTNNGGNKLAQGQIYVTRNAEAAGYKSGDQLVFKDGKVDTTVNGIIDGYYYISGQLVVGEGLVEIEEGKYIFVRSAGQLATGDYWVTPDKANDIVEGGMLYNFGADGYLTIDPTKNGIVDGTYYKEGVPYYAGLIEIDGETYYVKSNGEIAKGWYYVTKTNGIELETNKLFFDEEGKMVELKNGIHEGTDGKLYYYVNGEATGVGLIEIDGDIYYVRTTNGEVVTGTYYITATNGIEGFENGDKLTFGADGKLVK